MVIADESVRTIRQKDAFFVFTSKGHICLIDYSFLMIFFFFFFLSSVFL
jgi:hypothetical protein